MALSLTTWAAPGCDSQVKVSDRNVKNMDYASVVELQTNPARIKKMGPVVWVDVRSEEDYAKGHIPGTINIPMPQISGMDPRLAQARTIVVYGDGWRDDLVIAAWKKMTAMGYSGLFAFRGGIKEWTDQGRLLEPPQQTKEAD